MIGALHQYLYLTALRARYIHNVVTVTGTAEELNITFLLPLATRNGVVRRQG